MKETNIRTFSEIYCLLKFFPESYIDKFPTQLLNMIKQNSDSKFFIDVDTTKTLGEQNISKETKNTLVVLKYNYWADEAEKRDIMEQLNRNENKYQEALREKYNPNNLFKYNETNVETMQKSIAKVEYKETIFTKIKKWLERNLS